MRSNRVAVCILTAFLILTSVGLAQVVQLSSAPASITVPRLIRIRGVVRDEASRPLSGSIAITFSLYRDESDPVAVWQETQNVQLDSAGHYGALLGAANDAGLPVEIFSAGEARWLGVRAEGQSEQPRILFLSVAYALKAADADMLGGKPASAFVLADSQNRSTQPGSESGIGSGSSPNRMQVQVPGPAGLPLLVAPQAACSSITSDGNATANQIAKFTSACNIENSTIFESGANVGIGNTSPAGMLDVSGTAVIRGSLSAMGGSVMTPTGTATASQGYISNPLDIDASLFNTTLGRAANYIFRWQAEPVGNDTSSTSATLNLLYGVTGSISETGISVDKNGILSFAAGQTFPGTGTGTVTSVGTGAGLTGGPITKTGTISIPSAGVTNSMLTNNSITVQAGSGLSGGGTVALGGTVTVAANLSGTTNGIAYFASPANVISTAAPTSGQMLIGSAGGPPKLSTLTAGQNVTITNGPGSVTISATGGSAGTLPFFATGGGHTGGKQGPTQNVTKLWGFLLPYSVTTTQVVYDITTADNSSNNYDIGIFTNTGSLVVDLGPIPGSTFAPSVGFRTLTWAEGSTNLAAGQFYLALTTNCSTACAKLASATAFVSFAINASAGASTGGALPSTITPPADKWATDLQPVVVIK